MLRDATQLVHYLLDRGLLSRSDVVEGPLSVVPTPRRNRNFKVRTRSGGLFVKSASGEDRTAPQTLANEGHFLAALAEGSDHDPIAPRLLVHDERRSLLVLELVAGATALGDYHRSRQTFPSQIGSAVGKALAKFHHQAATVAEPSRPDGQRPWILSLHEQPLEQLRYASPANRRIVELLREHDQFGQSLSALRKDWVETGIIHGDLKWDNCLLIPRSESAFDVRFIDFEMVGRGDPLWDVGSLLHSYLAFWIWSMPASDDPAAMVATAPFPIEAMRLCLQRFWDGYVEGVRLPAERQRGALTKCVAYAGARMIQTCYEAMVSSNEPPPSLLYVLQASMNVMASPAEAAADLFGVVTYADALR